MVPYFHIWHCSVGSRLVLHGSVLHHMVQFGPVWSFMVLHEISDNYASQHDIIHNRIRKIEKNKKALNGTIYHDIAKDDTRYLLLDSMFYQKMARNSSFCNKLYPCAPIVRLVFLSFDLIPNFSPLLYSELIEK